MEHETSRRAVDELVGGDPESRGGLEEGRATAGPARVAAGSEPALSHPCQDEGPFDVVPDEELLYDLADLFRVFSDTTRIKILYSLMGRELCVADIADAVSSTQSAVSHQLRILKQARLVRFRREGRSIMYALADDHVYTMLAQGMTHICE